MKTVIPSDNNPIFSALGLKYLIVLIEHRGTPYADIVLTMDAFDPKMKMAVDKGILTADDVPSLREQAELHSVAADMTQLLERVSQHVSDWDGELNLTLEKCSGGGDHFHLSSPTGRYGTGGGLTVFSSRQAFEMASEFVETEQVDVNDALRFISIANESLPI